MFKLIDFRRLSPLELLAGWFVLGRTMDPRYVISALAGILAAVVIFATVTTVRHISRHSASPGIAQTD
jgi:hypothetical protein